MILLLGAAVYVSWLGFHGSGTGDDPKLFAPAMDALLAGHIGAYFAHLPLDGAGGSLLLRAPAALLGKLLIGGQLATYRFGAAGCVLASGGLGLWLARGLRDAGRPLASRMATVAVFVLSPAALDAIYFGHPEEPLGAALCVTAVLFAGARRPALAGVALGLAVMNKPWAVVAVAPVLLAAPSGRLRLLLTTLTIAAGWALAAYLANPARFGLVLNGTSETVLAHPPELWWPFAHWETRTVTNPLWQLLHGPGQTTGFFPPGLLSRYAHELTLLLAALLCAPLARQRERDVSACLALLALLFLLRCLLDPANFVYYEVPFVIALGAWEVRSGRTPLLALAATAALWVVFDRLLTIAGRDVQYAAYLLVVLPLAVALLGPATGRSELPRLRLRPAPAPAT